MNNLRLTLVALSMLALAGVSVWNIVRVRNHHQRVLEWQAKYDALAGERDALRDEVDRLRLAKPPAKPDSKPETDGYRWASAVTFGRAKVDGTLDEIVHADKFEDRAGNVRYKFDVDPAPGQQQADVLGRWFVRDANNVLLWKKSIDPPEGSPKK